MKNKQKSDIVSCFLNLKTLFFQIGQLQVDIREKDILIHKKSKTVTQLNDDVKQKSNEINILRKSVENLREQVIPHLRPGCICGLLKYID